jgi:heptose I phosphotransferase
MPIEPGDLDPAGGPPNVLRPRNAFLQERNVCKECKVVYARDHASLQDEEGFDSFAHIFHAQGLLVDKNRWREVIRLPGREDGSIPFLKRFLGRDLSSASELARSEWNNIERFRSAGFPGPTCVARGFSMKKDEGAFLLFLAPEKAESLSPFLEQASPRERRRLLSQLARTLAEMHRAGIRMPDLMARHVMVQPRGSFYFIDLARLRFDRRSFRGALLDLAGLSATLEADLLSLTERLRFLKDYMIELKGRVGKDRIAAAWQRIKSLEKKARKRRRFPDTFTLKERRSPGGRVYFNVDFEEALEELELRKAEDFLRPAKALLLRDLGLRRNYRFELEGKTYYLKVHEESHASGKTSKGRREWENHLLLSRVGIPAPRPAAWGEGKGSSFFMSLACAGRTAEDLAPDWSGQPPGSRRRIVRSLAFRIARLHGYGLFHRDLYLSHVIVEGDRVRIIDLQRLVERPLFKGHRRIKDLAALLYSSFDSPITRTERLRFLKIYLGGGKISRAGRRLIRRIERKARRIARHAGPKGARST